MPRVINHCISRKMIKNLRALTPLLWRGIFWTLLGSTLILSLTPVQQLPQALSFWDKAQHALGFAALAISGLLAYPARTWRFGLGLVLLGVGIELAQAWSGWRHGDWLDWLADCVGLALGWLATRLWRRRF